MGGEGIERKQGYKKQLGGGRCRLREFLRERLLWVCFDRGIDGERFDSQTRLTFFCSKMFKIVFVLFFMCSTFYGLRSTVYLLRLLLLLTVVFMFFRVIFIAFNHAFQMIFGGTLQKILALFKQDVNVFRWYTGAGLFCTEDTDLNRATVRFGHQAQRLFAIKVRQCTVR